MIKQIDRVINDLQNQAARFRESDDLAMTVAVVGANHAEKYTSYEGDRAYVAEGSRSPERESLKAIERLNAGARPHYEEFLILPFQASNAESFPFAWSSLPSTRQELNAALLRTLRLYENRFG